MALLDVQCDNEACGAITEIVRTVAEYGTPYPPCAACGGTQQKIGLPPRTTWTVDAVVVYRAPDGSYRFPGDSDGDGSAKYHGMGYERVELRCAADVRRFEREVGRQMQSEESRRVESRHQQRDRRESENRSHLFQRMKTMSNFGRDLAHAAMARGNARPQERSHGAPIHVEVYSNDRSNREPDRRGRRD